MGQHDRNGDVATEGSGQLADDTKGFDQVKIIFKLNQHLAVENRENQWANPSRPKARSKRAGSTYPTNR